MKKHLIAKLLDISEVYQEIHEFCQSFPEFKKAQATAELALQKIEELIGYEKTAHFEEVLGDYYSMQAQAYYLFGLQLRQALREEMFAS